MSSDEVDSKTEEMDLKTKNDDSKSEDERDSSPEPAKTNNKVSKKKAPPAPKIKVPAKKRVKAEQAEKETEEVKKEKKKVEESEEDEEDDKEEEEDIKDDKKNGVKKGVPLLDQPLEISGSRNRKQVERFTVAKMTKENDEQKVVVIPEGNGKQLGEIPIIDNNVQRFKVENIKLLHRICFNRSAKATEIKKNILLFNGFDFEKDSAQYEKKVALITKYTMKELKTICMILDLEKNKKKEELVEVILTFLLKPEDSGKELPQGRSKRKNVTLKTYDESDSELNPDPKRKKSPRTKGKKKNLKEDSESGSEKGEEQDDKKPEEEEKDADDDASSKLEIESDLDEEPKKKKTKKAPAKKEKKTVAPPKKRAAAKKAALAKKTDDESDDDEPEEDNAESEESDDEPLAKTNKAHPTDDEIKAYVKSILEGADLEEITMKTVCKQVYSHYPEFDLGQKKSFIKTTVKSLISS